MGAKRVVMVGTDPMGKGGVASVVSVYRDHGLFARYSVRYVATHREGGAIVKAWAGFHGVACLLWLLLTNQAALVHAHVASHASFKRKAMCLALAQLFGVPTVFHLHGGGFKRFADETASPRLRRWIVHTVQRSTAVVALSESWAGYLRGIAPSADVHVVANPVFVPSAAARGQEEPGRVLFLGRASQQKGVFDLLAAFATVSAQRPESRLVIGGDGDLDALRVRAFALGLAGRVEVLGWVSGDAKQAQMARAQVFVLPSYDEGLPMAMLEAMAHGKAIVVTPVGGIPEAVQHGQQGLLVQPGAVDDLAHALVSLVDDAALRARLGDAARARVAERFGTVHVLGRIGALYESLGILPSQAE